ncbi:tyrosine-protein phosphatase [Staphylococcus aureus]
MIDIHNHILPNIDDGPTNETEMLDLLKQATTQGVTEIIVTSHHLHPRYTTPIEKVKSCLNHIESLEEVQALNLKFYYGQEIRITDQILNDIDRKVITGINDSRYLLIEFPSNEVPHYTDQLFFELQSKGFVPIIAHPERNKAISQNLDILYDLINKGALSQVTTASLAGISGKKIRKLAIQMIENNLTHFIGSDAHNTEIRPFLMKDLFNDKKLRDYYEDMNGFISNAKLVVDDKKIPKRMPQQDYKQNYTDQLFFELQSKGFVPIIAHPERNKAISQNLDILYDLINKGALSQVTTASLAGISGKKIRKLAIQMIENNLTHFIGSDAHNTEIRPFLMKDLFNDKKLRDYYEDMNGFISNAKLVVDDKKIPKRMPQQDYKQKRWFGL